jgi:hypothetical protein
VDARCWSRPTSKKFAGKSPNQRLSNHSGVVGDDWYLIAPSGNAGGNGKTLRYFKDGVRQVRRLTYHPGIRPWVVNAGDDKTRPIKLGFGNGANVAGSFAGPDLSGAPTFESGVGRGLLRVLVFRAQRRIVDEIFQQLKLQGSKSLKITGKFVEAGFGADPGTVIRNAIYEGIEDIMKSLVNQIRRAIPKHHPDTIARDAEKPDPRRTTGPLKDAFSYRMPENGKPFVGSRRPARF